MRSSLNLSRLCQSQLMLMAIISACMVASHQNSRLRRISILLTDTLNLHSMASCVIFSGLTQWMTAKQERCASAKTFKESVQSNSDWNQSKRFFARTTSSLSFAPIKYKSMATRCIVGEAIRLSHQSSQFSVLQTIVVSTTTRALLF